MVRLRSRTQRCYTAARGVQRCIGRGTRPHSAATPRDRGVQRCAR